MTVHSIYLSKDKEREGPNSLLILADGINPRIVTLCILKVMQPTMIAFGFLFADGFPASLGDFLRTPDREPRVRLEDLMSKGHSHRDHFLDVMNVKVPKAALLRPGFGVSIIFYDSPAQVLELLIGETEHGNFVFRILGCRRLEGPVEDVAVKFFG